MAKTKTQKLANKLKRQGKRDFTESRLITPSYACERRTSTKKDKLLKATKKHRGRYPDAC